MNKEQLEESIRSVYGVNIDAHTYLQKFIHIETTLPKRAVFRGNNDLNVYSKKLLELHDLETWGDDRNIIDCIEALAAHFSLSLRQLEKTYTNLAIAYSTSAENQLRLVPLVTFLSMLKVVKPQLFRKLSAGQLTFQDLIHGLGFATVESDEASRTKLNWILDWLRYSLLSNIDQAKLTPDNRFGQMSQSLWRYNVEPQRLIPIFCAQLNMFEVN